MRGKALLLLLLLPLVAGGVWWRVRQKPVTAATQAAQLALTWRGSNSVGTITLPAHITWCPVTRIGTLEAISGDTGVVVAYLERDSLTSGPHAVVLREMVSGVTRPAATVGFRWVRVSHDSQSVIGMLGEAGTSMLRLGHGTASGEIESQMQSLSGKETLTLRGKFVDVPVIATAAGCT